MPLAVGKIPGYEIENWQISCRFSFLSYLQINACIFCIFSVDSICYACKKWPKSNDCAHFSSIFIGVLFSCNLASFYSQNAQFSHLEICQVCHPGVFSWNTFFFQKSQPLAFQKKCKKLGEFSEPKKTGSYQICRFFLMFWGSKKLMG